MGRHLQALMLNAATVEVRSSMRRFTFLPDSNGWVTITVTVSLKTEDPGNQRTNSPFGHLSIKLCVCFLNYFFQ